MKAITIVVYLNIGLPQLLTVMLKFRSLAHARTKLRMKLAIEFRIQHLKTVIIIRLDYFSILIVLELAVTVKTHYLNGGNYDNNA